MTPQESFSTTDRRSFLKSMLVAGTAPMVLSSRLFGSKSPSNQVTLGFIGVGGQGHDVNLMALLQQDDCRAIAVCDVAKKHLERARKTINNHYGNEDCAVFADFRELLAREDIDGVVISTPDHWHVTIAMMAIEAGKKVFCEKPTITIAEGRELADFVKRTGATFCTGLEDRSIVHYHKMAEAVRNGAIGELRHIEVGLQLKPIFPVEDAAPVPDNLDWDMWLGPAPYRPYSPSITHPQVWRQIREFSGGSLTDWGAHLVDTANVANFAELVGPVEVSGKGFFPPDSINSVAQTYDINYTFVNGVTMHVFAGEPSIRFEGSEGWVGNEGWRGSLEASDMDIYRRKYEPEENKMWPRPPAEHRNFLDVVRNGKPPIYTAESLHRLSTTLHLGSIAMELERPLKWDAKKESFDDAEANALRSRPRREDWAKTS